MLLVGFFNPSPPGPSPALRERGVVQRRMLLVGFFQPLTPGPSPALRERGVVQRRMSVGARQWQAPNDPACEDDVR